MEITLFAENVEARGQLLAVTKHSIRVRADIDVEDAYSAADRLEVSFSLPIGSGTTRVQTRVIGREISDRAVLYELDFEVADPLVLKLLAKALEAPVNP